MKEGTAIVFSAVIGFLIPYIFYYLPFFEFNANYFFKIILFLLIIETLFFLLDIELFYKFYNYLFISTLTLISSITWIFSIKSGSSNYLSFLLFITVITILYGSLCFPRGKYFVYKFSRIKLVRSLYLIIEHMPREEFYLLIFFIGCVGCVGIIFNSDFSLLFFSILSGYICLLIPFLKRKNRELELFSILGMHPHTFMEEAKKNKRIREHLSTMIIGKLEKEREKIIELSLFHLSASLTAYLEERFVEAIVYSHSVWEKLFGERSTRNVKLVTNQREWNFSSIRNTLVHPKADLEKEDIEPYLPEIAEQAIKVTVEKLNLNILK